jgi:hypothetical protein
MRYAFTTPKGWSRSPFPPPQRGVYLRAPVSTPSPESASILLFDVVAPAGTMEEHLAQLVKQGCEGAKVVKTSKPAAIKTVSFPGLTMTAQVQVPGAGRSSREEIRIFTLVDAGADRLPVAFIGGPRSMPMHKEPFETLIRSISPLSLAPELYSRWAD